MKDPNRRVNQVRCPFWIVPPCQRWGAIAAKYPGFSLAKQPSPHISHADASQIDSRPISTERRGRKGDDLSSGGIEYRPNVIIPWLEETLVRSAPVIMTICLFVPLILGAQDLELKKRTPESEAAQGQIGAPNHLGHRGHRSNR
jgi:hypothetical protein